MSDVIEISVDMQGCITVPADIRDRLGLLPGMTLVVEERDTGVLCLRVQEELPELVDRQGVLVVKANAAADLTDVVGHERNQRLSQLMQRAGL